MLSLSLTLSLTQSHILSLSTSPPPNYFYPSLYLPSPSPTTNICPPHPPRRHRISSRANLTLQVVPSSTLAVNPTPLPIPTPPSTATPTSGAGGSAFHTVRHQRSSMGLPADHRGFSGVRPGLLVCAGLQRMIAASTEPTATPEAGGGGAGGGDDMADSYPSACPPRPVVHSLSHSPYDVSGGRGLTVGGGRGLVPVGLYLFIFIISISYSLLIILMFV